MVNGAISSAHHSTVYVEVSALRSISRRNALPCFAVSLGFYAAPPFFFPVFALYIIPLHFAILALRVLGHTLRLITAPTVERLELRTFAPKALRSSPRGAPVEQSG